MARAFSRGIFLSVLVLAFSASPLSTGTLPNQHFVNRRELRITAFEKFLRVLPSFSSPTSRLPPLRRLPAWPLLAAPMTEGEAATDNKSEVLGAFCLMNHEGSGGPQPVAIYAVVATLLTRATVTTTATASCHTFTPPSLPASPCTASPCRNTTIALEGAAGGRSDLAGVAAPSDL